MTSKFTSTVLLAALVFAIAACDSTETLILPTPLPATMVEDVAADPASHDPNTGETVDTGRFTFFNLQDNEVVLSYDEDDRSDSLSTNWDIAFQGTTILINGGAGQMGDGGVQVLAAAFDDVTEAPETGYETSFDEDWYNYAGAPTHLVTPVPGHVLVIKTADGRYAKLRILSYYEGAPEAPDAFVDTDRYYTFEFVFQPDGSRSFEQ